MKEAEIIDISGVLGLIAMGLLCFNCLLGMLLGTSYKKSVYWKKMPEAIKRIGIDSLHNYTAYIALLFVLLHPMVLFVNRAGKFGIRHLFFPLESPTQPGIVLLGSISLLSLLIIILTTQKRVKQQLGYRAWKNIHLISYPTALLFLFHGLLMDPLLQNRPTDWLDAEKFFAEFCLALIMLASVFRIRYHLMQPNIKR